ncbi:alpha/beta fold hydrolase [Nocardiopsis oceani]
MGQTDLDRTAPATVRLNGADGLRLTADVWGHKGAPKVLMLHGGGQTRHSWKATGGLLAQQGFQVVALDSRGHGDSDWSPQKHYGFERNRDDVLAVLDQVGGPVIIIGASMGGLTGILVAEEAGPERVRGLALVDIVPRFETRGGDRVGEFMRGAPEGFSSLQEAADAIAAYLPHRPRPKSTEGLRRNLRLREDGRWHWHWDPAMMANPPKGDPIAYMASLEKKASSLTIPVMLLHGKLSDVVTDEGVGRFRAAVPGLEVVSLPGVAHTAAGDDNDAFTRAVEDFCARLLGTDRTRPS